MSEEEDSDKYEYYIIHDSIGVSHVFRRPMGVHPSIKCDNCD